MLVWGRLLPKNTNILGDSFVGEPGGRIYFWITGNDFWLESGALFGLVDVQEGFWTRNANKVMHSDLEPMRITQIKEKIILCHRRSTWYDMGSKLWCHVFGKRAMIAKRFAGSTNCKVDLPKDKPNSYACWRGKSSGCGSWELPKDGSGWRVTVTLSTFDLCLTWSFSQKNKIISASPKGVMKL